MKKIIGLSSILFAGITLSGCSDIIEDPNIEIAIKRETGNGSIELLTPKITTKDNQLVDLRQDCRHTQVNFLCCATSIFGVFHIPSRPSK